MINNRIWYLGTTVASIAVLLLGWFLGVAPKLAEASAADRELVAVQGQNQLKQTELTRLKTQFTDVGGTRAALATVRESLPSSADTTAFLGELETLQLAHSVNLRSLSISEAQPYVPSIVVTDEPAEAEAEEDAADPETTAAPTGVESAGVAAADPAAVTSGIGALTDPRVTGDNFVLIPVNLELEGSAGNATAFIGALQSAKRLFLVTDVSMEVNDKAGSEPSAVTVSVSGYLYVLLENADPAVPGSVVELPTGSSTEASGTHTQ